MKETKPATRYRFGIFEVDSATGELRRKCVRVKLHSQPLQVLMMLLVKPGEMLTREDICRKLWSDGTFVDNERGMNSAVNRLREALGDKASNPRFVETMARHGYHFVAPVEPKIVGESAPTFLKLWWLLLVVDLPGALSLFLLLHHMNYGLTLACMTPLIYSPFSPFAQRSIVLMGAGEAGTSVQGIPSDSKL